MNDDLPWYIRYWDAVDLIGHVLVVASKDDDAIKRLEHYYEVAELDPDAEPDAEQKKYYDTAVVRPANYRLQQVAQAGNLKAWGYRITDDQDSSKWPPSEDLRSEIPRIAWVDNWLDVAKWSDGSTTSAVGPFAEDKWLYLDLIFDRSEIDQICERILGDVESQPKPTGRLTAKDEEIWYRAYVKSWPPDVAPPGEKDDLKAYEQHFNVRTTRKRIRWLRNDFAPLHWKRAGPRPKALKRKR